MDLCGNLVSAIADFFAVEHLSSTAEFPVEIDRLMSLVQSVNDIYMVRDQLSADVADLSNLIKGLLIRAEDCRLMRDM
jgi:Bardet-Biedl syndrome 2 protein